MLKEIKSLVTITALALLCSFVLPPSVAEEFKTPPAPVPPEEPSRPFPFRGRIHEVDVKALTITLEGRERNRVVHVTHQTKIVKAGRAAKIEDAQKGEEIAGQVVRRTDGEMEARSIRLGPREAPSSAPAAEPKE